MILIFSLKGEEGGDDDGEKAQGHLDGIALNLAGPLWNSLLEEFALIISNTFRLGGVLGIGGKEVVWHAIGILSVSVNSVNDILTEVASVVRFAIAVGEDGESSLSFLSADDITFWINTARLATVGAWGANLSISVVASSAKIAGAGQIVASNTVIDGSVDASTITIKCFSSWA